MSSSDTQPITEEEAIKSKLIAKFGAELMRDGFIAIPRLLKKRCREIGITPTEHFFWETVISFQYSEDLPWPSIERIADEMGRSERSVKRYIRRMEDKGRLRVERSHTTEGEIASNRYDFSPLYEQILALDKSQTQDAKSGMKPLKSTTAGDTFVTWSTPNSSHQNSQNSSQNGHSNGHSMPKMPTNLSAEMAVEEYESQEDESQIDTSNLRSANAQNSKGRVLNTRSKQNGSSHTNNQTSNNSNTPNTSKTKTETVAPEQAAPAPPAWSNVPNTKQEVTPLPTYAAQVIEGISRQFHDLAPKSSMTIAARMYQEIKAWGADEYAFGEIAGYAKSDANKANVKKQNPDGTINRMPYFFKMLRKNIDHNTAIWAEEAEGDRRRAEEVLLPLPANKEQSNNEGS